MTQALLNTAGRPEIGSTEAVSGWRGAATKAGQFFKYIVLPVGLLVGAGFGLNASIDYLKDHGEALDYVAMIAADLAGAIVVGVIFALIFGKKEKKAQKKHDAWEGYREIGTTANFGKFHGAKGRFPSSGKELSEFLNPTVTPSSSSLAAAWYS